MGVEGKKIMLLGGNYFQMTATIAAKELGCHVISVDYLPDNPAHKYADEYHNVSTIDKEAVLALAQKLQIDGIVSYASDVSAPTAAYVAEKMGLPTNPYESVMILTHKNLFRKFMHENGLRMPEGKSFTDRDEAFEYFQMQELPIMIKPIDASGSKGVIKVQVREQFQEAFDEAMSYSIAKQIIIEKFIEKEGYQIDGDGFIVDGKIRFFGVMDQHNDLLCAPHTPIGLSSPSIQDKEVQKKARKEIQKIFDILGMRFGAFNFEYIIDKDKNINILEIGPRNGGNFITDTLKVSSDIDLAKYTIRAALGENCQELRDAEAQICASSYIVHALKKGKFEHLEISKEIEKDIIKQVLFVEPGDEIECFRNAGMGIGAMVIKFSDVEDMCYKMDHMEEFIRVIVK